MSHSAMSIAASTFIRSGTPGRPPYHIRSLNELDAAGVLADQPPAHDPIAVASDAEVCQS